MQNFITPGDDLVRDVSLYVKRKPLFHGYALPFLVFYGAGFFAWTKYFDADQYDAAIIISSAIGVCHILTILFCFWSVDVKCWLTCSKVSVIVVLLMLV